MAAPKVLVLVADGSEEMEAVITIDCLRRCQVEVTVAGLLSTSPITCARLTTLLPDTSLPTIAASAPKSFDAIALPGGVGGANAFAGSTDLHAVLRAFEKEGKIVAAICAAPIALKAAGVGVGKRITSHPSVRGVVVDDYKYSEERVVIDGKLITSRGPGTAFEFAFAIAKQLKGIDAVLEAVDPMLLPPGSY
ncbi:DJ-1 family protein [Blyttiomyces helicus]|uniref:D-lactate dehydratase n=1 Tax=Blyttiomyces helicus TaxID=388810 RepID=A0A4P9WJA4_9FUNG|nr:DJ-1 family protein [Blyttiomyces helicus]|eukprot:RKO92999.1 DJ-1 family protein [Blyttiomyces helicus]